MENFEFSNAFLKIFDINGVKILNIDILMRFECFCLFQVKLKNLHFLV